MLRDGGDPHPAALMHAREFGEGKISRREFLARATSLGVSAASAYGLIGAVATGARAQARQGGTLRIQMEVREMKDPRLADWSEIANFYRGTFEYLVEYRNDGSFVPYLLEGWEVNSDATEYVLRLRPGVTWSNGDPFTAEDVARNIARWCDKTVEDNSMVGRFNTLIDLETNVAIDGAIVVEDDLTVRLLLPRPDISLIAGMADYPAAIVHQSFQTENFLSNVGTGPYAMQSLEVGVKSVLARNTEHDWWGAETFGGPYLDTIEFIDFGTDPAAWLNALETGQVDMLYESVGEFIDIMDDMGFDKTEVMTAATIVIRGNQTAEVDGRRPYEDVRVRRALQLAVDNAVLLELGYANLGTVAENHHVAPVHPEYAELPPPAHDPSEARRLMAEAGMESYEHELISIDDDWRNNTTDAVAAQLRDAGFDVRRTVVPGSIYTHEWTRYPFSSTNWNHRPLGVQVYALAYRSGEAWNEFGWANEEFDSLLNDALSIADADSRREVMRRLQKIVQDEGVAIQPYWRSLYRHARPGLVGAEMHVTFEIHPYALGFAA